MNRAAFTLDEQLYHVCPGSPALWVLLCPTSVLSGTRAMVGMIQLETALRQDIGMQP